MVSNCSVKKLYSWPLFTAFVLRQDPIELPGLPQTCCPLVSTSQLPQAEVCATYISCLSAWIRSIQQQLRIMLSVTVHSPKGYTLPFYWHIFPDVPSQLCKDIFLYFGTSDSTIFELLYTLISFICFKSSLSNHKMWMAERFWNGRMKSELQENAQSIRSSSHTTHSINQQIINIDCLTTFSIRKKALPHSTA